MPVAPSVPRTNPSPSPERNSRWITRHQSRNRTSPRAIARMTRVVACEPEFPPLEITSGMNNASTTAREISASYRPIADAVSVSPRNSTDSQPARLRIMAIRPVSK